jgi:hypothetical protein
MDRKRIQHTSVLLLERKLEEFERHLKDPVVHRFYKQVKGTEIGSIFLDLYHEAAVRA